MSGPGAPSLCRRVALCVGARRSLCRGPALCVGVRRSYPDALSVVARRSVSGPGALCLGARRSYPGALCDSVSGPGACRRCVSGPALLFLSAMSGPGALCVVARRSVSGPIRLPSACHPSGTADPQLPSACPIIRHVGESCEPPANPHATHPCSDPRTDPHELPSVLLIRAPIRVPPIRPRSRRHRGPQPPTAGLSSDPRSQLASGPASRGPAHPAPRAPSSHVRATHPARRVPFFQERTPNLTVWGKIGIHACIDR